MKRSLSGLIHWAIVFFCAVVPQTHAQVSFDAIICIQPLEPYPEKLKKAYPLFEAARADHRRHLEELEGYVNCLDRERGHALTSLQNSFDLFIKKFGGDAVLRYSESHTRK